MRLAVGALCLVQFVDVLGVTVIVTTLPSMLRDLHASANAGGVIATGYAMFFGGLLMLGARLGDRFGHRRTTLVGLVVFAVAAILGATAGSVAILTASRCLQGAAAAISVPSALRLLTTITAEGEQRAKAIALWSAAGAAAGASGFVVGGVITQLAGWRVVFWAYLPLAAGLTTIIAATVPGERSRERAVTLTPASAAAFTAATMLFVLATNVLPRPGQGAVGAGLLVVSAATALVFIGLDRRASAPLFPRTLLRQPSLRQGALGGLLNTATTSSAITLATLYLQNTRGESALAAGLLLLPFSLAAVVGAGLAPRALARWSAQQVIAVGLAAIAVFDATLIPAATQACALPVCEAAGGIGIGLSSVAATGLGTSVVAGARATASGIINTAAQLGTAIGIATLLLIASVTSGAPASGTPRPAIAWGFATVVSLGGAIAFALRSRLQASPSEHRAMPAQTRLAPHRPVKDR